jgi:hypothetical protein
MVENSDDADPNGIPMTWPHLTPERFEAFSKHQFKDHMPTDHVEPDQAPPHGISRPAPYDWKKE